MSSHHFVKEGQEPALLVLTPFPFQLAGPLLEWAPLVIVSEDALSDVLTWGIKIDVVVLSESRKDEFSPLLLEQAPLRILLYTHSPLRTALDFLMEERQQVVNILSAGTDGFSELSTFVNALQISLIDAKFKWSAVSSGRFEKWMPASALLKVQKTSESQKLLSTGLVEKEGFFESSGNGLVRLESEVPFWVAEAFQE